MSDANRANLNNEDEKSPSFLKRLAQLLRGDNAAAAIRESLEEVIEESDLQSTALSAPERTMLANLLKFGELQVKDVMVPRADIVAVEEKTSLSDLILLFREAQHSRLPVYRETLDDPIGLVHLKSVLELLESEGERDFRLRESSLKYDVQWFHDAAFLFGIHSSRWSRQAGDEGRHRFLHVGLDKDRRFLFRSSADLSNQ